MPSQQMVTLEEMLPHLRPGGVYLCEDVHRIHHPLAAFAGGLIDELNRTDQIRNDGLLRCNPSAFQRSVHSIHLYPFVLAIEKHEVAVSEFSAPKRGTDWQPFFPPAKSMPED
jgi:hypothetical protein